MPNMKPIFDATWDETPVDVTAEANFIWSIANKLRGSYIIMAPMSRPPAKNNW